VVCLDRGQFELGDETVEFIDNEDRSETVQPCLTENGNCLTQSGGQLSAINGEQHANLRAYALHYIHEDERPVT
jgi:hypothetical protein